MRIAHVTARYPPHLGGLELVVQELARRQVKAGHAVHVVTSSTAGPMRQDDHGVLVHRLRSYSGGSTVIALDVVSALRALHPRPEVLHLHGTSAGWAEQVAVAARVMGIPYIAHLHLLVRPSTVPGRMLLPMYQRSLYRLHLAGAAKVICLTEAMAREVRNRYSLRPEKITVIANGAPNLIEASADVPRREDQLLFVGRVTAQKNILILIEAMASLPDLHLRVIGDGDQLQPARELISRLGLTNVRLDGRQPKGVVAAAYREATALVMPSSHEGMPLVLLEALASGLPVISSPIPEVQEVAGEAVAYLRSTIPEQIADDVLELVSTPDRLQELSHAGQKLAGGHTWEASTEAVTAVYQAALSDRDNKDAHRRSYAA